VSARIRQAAARAWRAVKIGMRAARVLATSRALPLPLRCLLVIGMVQVPFLPCDEIALAVALAWLALRHRGTLRTALAAAAAYVDGRP
jgi:hypothetical protein